MSRTACIVIVDAPEMRRRLVTFCHAARRMLAAGASLLEIGDGYTQSRIRSALPILKWL